MYVWSLIYLILTKYRVIQLQYRYLFIEYIWFDLSNNLFQKQLKTKVLNIAFKRFLNKICSKLMHPTQPWTLWDSPKHNLSSLHEMLLIWNQNLDVTRSHVDLAHTQFTWSFNSNSQHFLHAVILVFLFYLCHISIMFEWICFQHHPVYAVKFDYFVSKYLRLFPIENKPSVI